jgi:integrase
MIRGWWVGSPRVRYDYTRSVEDARKSTAVTFLRGAHSPSVWDGAGKGHRQPQHYVFPAQRYRAAGDAFLQCAHSVELTKPIGSWGVAWAAAKKRWGERWRTHDLRHTACTRMLEAGIPFSVVASVMGWSASTTVRRAKRYGHIGQEAQKQAVAVLSGVGFAALGTKLRAV